MELIHIIQTLIWVYKSMDKYRCISADLPIAPAWELSLTSFFVPLAHFWLASRAAKTAVG